MAISEHKIPINFYCLRILLVKSKIVFRRCPNLLASLLSCKLLASLSEKDLKKHLVANDADSSEAPSK